MLLADCVESALQGLAHFSRVAHALTVSTAGTGFFREARRWVEPPAGQVLSLRGVSLRVHLHDCPGPRAVATVVVDQEQHRRAVEARRPDGHGGIGEHPGAIAASRDARLLWRSHPN